MAPTLLKLGGELMEHPDHLAQVVSAIARLSAEGPLVVVHGGGREIDVESARRGLVKQSVDGLRVTDAATLDVVVAVVGGTVNTRLVAALVAAGVKAVGLSGVDGGLVPVRRAPAHRAANGRLVDLGLVGEPLDTVPALALHLLAGGYVPVVACLGVDAGGQVFNVNADAVAASVARAAKARRLIVAGAVAGVLDAGGTPFARLDLTDVDRLVADGTATAGMVAKLAATAAAVRAGVAEVAIVDGRSADRIVRMQGTRIEAGTPAGSGQER
jgi:acetylglutamate kinase